MVTGGKICRTASVWSLRAALGRKSLNFRSRSGALRGYRHLAEEFAINILILPTETINILVLTE